MSDEEFQSCEKKGKKKIDFSIEGILREPYLSRLSTSDFSEETVIQIRQEDHDRAGKEDKMDQDSRDIKNYSWLYCSRFKPPKLPRKFMYKPTF